MGRMEEVEMKRNENVNLNDDDYARDIFCT